MHWGAAQAQYKINEENFDMQLLTLQISLMEPFKKQTKKKDLIEAVWKQNKVYI